MYSLKVDRRTAPQILAPPDLINVEAPSDFVHSLWLLVPPPQQVHLSPGLRANTSGEGGVLSALHLLLASSFFRQDLKEVARSTAL